MSKKSATSDLKRNACMLTGKFSRQGYDWWWHSLTARNTQTGEERPFFLEFYVCNPALAEDTPVFGQLPENKAAGKKPSYLMVKAGHWGKGAKQVHRFFPWKDVNLHYEAPFSVEADDCFVSDKEIRGSVSVSVDEAAAHPEYMCDAGTISWDLKIEKVIPFNVGYGAGSFLRALKAFEMYWHAEGMKTRYEGTIIADGVEYQVIPEKSYGYADKNWGANFTSPWVWLSSNDLVSKKTGERLENSVFDIGGGRPKVFFVSLNRILLSAINYEGTPIEFNFSKFWSAAKTKFDCQVTDTEVVWHVEQENRKYAMVTDITCQKDEMLLINYEAPDGKKRHNNLWNGGNGKGLVKLYKKGGGKRELIDELIVGHVGCEYGEFDPE